MHGSDRHGLDRLNSALPGVAEAALLACCGSRRWARHLADHRPYPDLRTLLATAERAARTLTPADLTEALADETGPRQLLVTHPALRRAEAAYESRFGHIFIIYPAPTAPPDDRLPDDTVGRLLAALRVRLGHSPREETAVTAAELTRLAAGRLTRLAPDVPSPRRHDARQA
ncbi:2-oxo-4-hydroxy-4-carboxy-5-ureidoimidazoline decarboxylase [Streptomyces sp. ISL-11]|uniref:2-oxo-4-hydroxy-4-carboxy-5-ureidoimidazoline decarboxylase n=1 Tax=Streptomyces sp. ISL-11 TaxID=2819174 RepID=UPI001BEA1086|nr:2-oxo-4-hydroxy-4-carboxy-5-ureidoimidazoline decarboxylase [Streptomyces sp. ISL-11]MBT2384828.1 2-oxo-4-hydroxy-4-carboxy-5-ureidoimidazoline decarboxylase [Streptomyces sp. ISL-11]